MQRTVSRSAKKEYQFDSFLLTQRDSLRKWVDTHILFLSRKKKPISLDTINLPVAFVGGRVHKVKELTAYADMRVPIR